MGPDSQGFGDATVVGIFLNCCWRLGVREIGARSAEARAAGFPCHHLMEASIAFRERVRKGSWMLFCQSAKSIAKSQATVI